MMKTDEVRILLVEDDDIDAMGVQRAFFKEKIANDILRAKDGVEALEILRGQSGNSIESPYIILLDLNMPRMNGLEFLEEIRKDEKLKESIVFVLTTSTDDQDITRSYSHSIAGYIVKSDAGRGFLNLVGMLDRYWHVVELPKL